MQGCVHATAVTDSSSLLCKVECKALLHKALGHRKNKKTTTKKRQLYKAQRQQIEALQREALGRKEDGEGGEALATTHHLPDPEGHQGVETQLDCNSCHVLLI